MRNNYNIENILHYLDDLFTAGPKQSHICEQSQQKMLTLCESLGTTVKPSKVIGPTTRISFLGIFIDSMTWTASVSEERKEEIQQELQHMTKCHTCTKCHMLSLIGKLSFACKVFPAGRIFLRRLIDKSMDVALLHQHITLNSETRADLRWWLDFLPSRKGSSPLVEADWTHFDLSTDASSIGYGTHWQGRWFFGSRSTMHMRSLLHGKIYVQLF